MCGCIIKEVFNSCFEVMKNCAFVNPKGNLLNSYNPDDVAKAVFSIESSYILFDNMLDENQILYKI